MRKVWGLLGAALLVAGTVFADEIEEFPSEAFLASITRPPALQAFLDATLADLLAADARLRQQTLHVALLDLPVSGAPRLAHRNGATGVYPASVPKFAYLMAAYAWRDGGRIKIEPAFDRQLEAMIYRSSNAATQKVFRRLTATRAGERLPPDEYELFAMRRHAVKRWLQDLGIGDLHLVHPTYDGGGDLYGRDEQFLQDPNVPGCLPNQTGEYRNRQSMSADDTAKLLALLARDLALSPQSSAEVRERMRRDPRRQPYLWRRIAGGADPGKGDLEVFSKTGTWGPIYADAGIVRHASGHELVVVVFLDGTPAYRGSFIADLTRAAVEKLLRGAATAYDPPHSHRRRGAARG